MLEKGAETVCWKCGFDESEISADENCLKLRTVLYGKYLLGQVLEQTDSEVAYLAWDLALKVKLFIKEYMPLDIADRIPGQAVLSAKSDVHHQQFENGITAFVEEAKKLASTNTGSVNIFVKDVFRENGTAYLVLFDSERTEAKKYGGQISNRILLVSKGLQDTKIKSNDSEIKKEPKSAAMWKWSSVIIVAVLIIVAVAIWNNTLSTKREKEAVATELPETKEKTSVKTANSKVLYGGIFKFGKYNDEPIIWNVINKDDNGIMLFSDKVISLKPYDALGDTAEGRDGGYRKEYGSNYWEKSNIREWLNSEDKRVNYSHQPPDSLHVRKGFNAYEDEPGLLTNFSQKEREAIKPVKHKCELSLADRPVKEGGEVPPFELERITDNHVKEFENVFYKYVTDRVYLLSIQELYYFVFKNNFKIMANPTRQAVLKNQYNENLPGENKFCQYWLRTPYMDDSGVLSVGTDDLAYNYFACIGCFGVRPAINLKMDITVSGKGTINDPYVLE
jgi:hypothetical protein